MGRGRRSQGKVSPRHPIRAASPSGRIGRPTGAVCEVCGKSQEHCLVVHLGGEKHIFDSFECAISGLLPKCPFCRGLILGPGVQVGDRQYCSYACASLPHAVEATGGAVRRASL